MSNNAMSNETDLDWLARNVHVWPENGNNMRDGFIPGSQYYGPYCAEVVWCKGGITKRQWLARRAELQNKPSWDEAPDWALSVTQRVSGEWFWLGSVDQFKGPSTSTGCVGVVLGDWRDTLERRSESTRAEMEVELVKAAFKPFTSIEDNQDQVMTQQQEMKKDNGWFERGEFPPVGVICEYTIGANAPWYQCEIKYVIRGDGVVMKRIPCGDEQYCRLHHRHPVSFRPIRTEREVAIEEMKRHLPYPGSWDMVGRVYAAALYDAGYRKEQK